MTIQSFIDTIKKMSNNAPVRWLIQSLTANRGSQVMPWLQWTISGHLAATANYAKAFWMQVTVVTSLGSTKVVWSYRIVLYVNNVGGILPTILISVKR